MFKKSPIYQKSFKNHQIFRNIKISQDFSNVPYKSKSVHIMQKLLGFPKIIAEINYWI